MSESTYLLELSAAPHLKNSGGLNAMMYQMLMSLVPVCIFGVWQYGLSALSLIFTCTVVSMATERGANFLSGRPSTITDGSAAITGLLLALTLPPGLPLWMGAVGASMAIALGKALFGGLGCNIFNPALVGRAFLQVTFPAAMAHWVVPFDAHRFTGFVSSSLAVPFCRPTAGSVLEVVTPLALQKFNRVETDLDKLLFGNFPGATGETCALLLIICGAFLIARKVVNWRVPVAVLGTAFAMSAILYLLDPAVNPSPFFTLFSGGLLLGALFMATDPVGSPLSPMGLWIFGAVIGALTVIIRVKGAAPEGIMYAILLGNALTPIIDRWTQPRVFGHGKRRHA